MANPVKSVIFICFLAALAGSCTAPIELKTSDSEPVIVIYGTLTEFMTQQIIQLSSSSPYFEEKSNQPVSDAVIVIESSDNQTFRLEEIAAIKGTYQTIETMSAIPGVTYRLKVSVDFNQDGIVETYEAVTTMPPPFHMDSIGIKTQNIMGYTHYALNMYAQEEPSVDFYLARYILNDTLMEYQISNFLVFTDDGINDQYLDGMTLMYFDDKTNNFMGNNETFTYVQSGDKITLCVSRIEKGYHDFIQQCQKEKRGENPFFGGPASNIATNISNGGVGYFTSYCTTAADAYVP
jgi:hypothetical protein